MFTYKSNAEITAMTDQEREKYATDKRTHEAAETQKAIDNAVKEFTKKGDVETEVNKAIEALKTSLKADSISKEVIAEIRETLNIVKEQGSTGGAKVISLKTAMNEAIKAALPKLQAMKAGLKEAGAFEKGLEVEITVKAASNVVVADWANDVPTPDVYVANQLTEYAVDVRPQAYIMPFIDKGNTDRPTIPFMDKIPNQGTMTVTAEGAVKPLISFSFKINYSNATKIAGRVKMSEEVLDDIPYVQSIASNELLYAHGIEWQARAFAKINAIAGAFVAGDMAGTTTNPTKYDAIRAAIYGVKIASDGMYVPNAVLINSADAYDMGATKDKNWNYVMPPWVMPDGTKISGVTIKEVSDGNNTVAAGDFIVGDFRKLKNRTYKQFSIRLGYGINYVDAVAQSDFETNMITMIGESREHFYVYENEEVAFIKDSFATVMEAIEAEPVI